MFRRRTLLTAAVALPAAAVIAPAVASADPSAFPTALALPNGFQPEGIAISGPFAYFGSLADGRILRVNLIDGSSRVISPGPGTPSVGLKSDGRRLFVAGGPAGDARVIDQRTGAVLAHYQFATGDTFINDVTLTEDAAWFTDSRIATLYGLPLRHGRLPAPADVVRLPLSGDYVLMPGFNANGIASTPDGRGLLIVQTNTATVFRVDPRSGVARKVDLGGEPATAGDGLLVDDNTLFVVQNQLNRVAVFRLNSAGTSGRLVERLTDPRLDVPTTVASFGRRLYLPNARFSTPPTPTTTYSAIAIRR
jgi:sugar lactone lactonase YvrE